MSKPTPKQKQMIAQNINTNMATTLAILQHLEPKPSEMAGPKATNILLGCIAMALNIQADIMLCGLEASNFLVPH